MAFLHSASTEVLTSSLELWTLPPTQTVVESGEWFPYKTTTPVQGSNTQEFHIPSAGSKYIDGAHCLYYCECKIVKDDGTDFVEADANDAALVNYPLHSMFSQVDTSLNQKVISQSSMTYPIKSYLEAVLNYDEPAKNSHMTMRMWHKDTPGAMDAFTGDTNEGLSIRRELTRNSRVVQLLGPLHIDFFNQDRFLLNNVDIRIKLTRSRDAFVLMSSNQNEKLVILDATLFVRRVQISPSVLLAHAAALEKAPAKYPFTRSDVKNFTIPAGLQSKTIPNLHLGQIPKRIIIGFISNQAYNGSYRHNPFNFNHYDLNYLALYIDGQQIPAQPLTPDFRNRAYVESYNTLFSGSGIHWKDEGNGISYADYGSGYTLFVFDLSQDLSAHEAHWNLQRQGTVQLDLRFSIPTPVAVNCVVYSEFSNLIEIDKTRSVVVDYNV